MAGWLPDVDAALDAARVMLAPITWGAGLKGKVTQSLAAGLPVVTTTIGAEGLDAIDGDELLIADDDEALAERVIRLLTDDELWESPIDGRAELADERLFGGGHAPGDGRCARAGRRATGERPAVARRHPTGSLTRLDPQ